MKEEDVEKKGRKSDRCPRARHALGKSGRWLIIVSDAVKGTKVDLDGKGHHVKRMKEIPQRWKQPKGTYLIEMRKEAKMLRMDQCGAQRRST